MSVATAADPLGKLKQRFRNLAPGMMVSAVVAMIIYPIIVLSVGLKPVQAGMFLGGTTHDVAQVVGAGYSLSTETGDTATVIKLMRVAMLLPVIVCAALVTRAQGIPLGGARPLLLPWFAVGFLVLAGISSTGWIPMEIISLANEISRWCLVIAISALGMKTHLKEILTVGFRPIALMVGETCLLAALVLLALHTL